MKTLDCEAVFEAVKSMLPQNKTPEVKEPFAVFD
jgi:hypothetical protein